MGRVGVVEGGGRLVKNQQTHLLRQCLGDFDELLLADADVGDTAHWVFIETDPQEQLTRFGVGPVPVDDPALGPLVAEEDVLRDREVRTESQLLMDDDDAAPLALAQVVELAQLAVEIDLAFVRAVRVDARQHLHEGGFAGAVLAADRVDLAACHRHAHVL